VYRQQRYARGPSFFVIGRKRLVTKMKKVISLTWAYLAVTVVRGPSPTLADAHKCAKLPECNANKCRSKSVSCDRTGSTNESLRRLQSGMRMAWGEEVEPSIALNQRRSLIRADGQRLPARARPLRPLVMGRWSQQTRGVWRDHSSVRTRTDASGFGQCRRKNRNTSPSLTSMFSICRISAAFWNRICTIPDRVQRLVRPTGNLFLRFVHLPARLVPGSRGRIGDRPG